MTGKPIQRTAMTQPNWPCEKGDVAAQRAKARDQAVRPLAGLRGRFPVRAAVPKDVPARPLVANVDRSAPFVVAVAPFREVRLDFGGGPQPGQLARSPCALERADQHRGEFDVRESLAQFPRFDFSLRGERDIGAAGVPGRERPFGFSVTDEVEAQQRILAQLSVNKLARG